MPTTKPTGERKVFGLRPGHTYRSVDWFGHLTRRRFRVVRRVEGFAGSDSFHRGHLPRVDLLALNGRRKGVTVAGCVVRSRGGVEYVDIPGDEIASRVVAKP